MCVFHWERPTAISVRVSNHKVDGSFSESTCPDVVRAMGRLILLVKPGNGLATSSTCPKQTIAFKMCVCVPYYQRNRGRSSFPPKTSYRKSIISIHEQEYKIVGNRTPTNTPAYNSLYNDRQVTPIRRCFSATSYHCAVASQQHVIILGGIGYWVIPVLYRCIILGAGECIASIIMGGGQSD